mmetsp:Transcript_30549/g.41855  ORF Transcript_30549/g.41855 Transcript_30549/m.41855 type:complete len:247 (-) Transcript_30549:60-800(-)
MMILILILALSNLPQNEALHTLNQHLVLGNSRMLSQRMPMQLSSSNVNKMDQQVDLRIVARTAAVSICAAINLVFASSAIAIEQQYKLPPIDYKDPNRCVLSASFMGQANAARDKLYDLRECDLKGQSGAGKDMSGMIGGNADFSGVNFKEAQISKAFARNSKFVGCDFTNAIVDRVSFDGSDLRRAVFANAVLSGTTFTNADLRDTDFSDAYLGPFDLKNLCLNPTLAGTNPVTNKDTRESAGCL